MPQSSPETRLIERIGQIIQNPQALRDDAFYDPEQRLIYTTDLLVEGRHFDQAYFSAADLGWKAAAVNISDIAAMGGRLRYLLVSIGLPTPDIGFVDAFYQALQAIATQYGGHIIGGDTVSAPQLVVNVTAIGELPAGHTPGLRHQASPGDLIAISGPHGLSAVGLQAFQKHWAGYPAAKQAHLRPVPRIREGLAFSQALPRYALMDTSDGLADALLKIAQASGAKLTVAAERLSIHPEVVQFAAQTGINPLDCLLYGGEDFELLATIPADTNPVLLQGWQVIGRVEPGEPSAFLREGDGSLAEIQLKKTYQHFENP